MEEINKKQMYYLLISTLFHQSQNTNTALQNSLKWVEELEKNYVCTERKLTDLFYKQGIKHRFPNKMINYPDSTFDTLKYDFKDINNVFQVTNFIELKNNLLKFKGIGEHKAQICILKYMILQGKSIDIDDYDQMLNNCCSLDETLFREIEIIKKLSNKNTIQKLYTYIQKY